MFCYDGGREIGGGMEEGVASERSHPDLPNVAGFISDCAKAQIHVQINTSRKSLLRSAELSELEGSEVGGEIVFVRVSRHKQFKTRKILQVEQNGAQRGRSPWRRCGATANTHARTRKDPLLEIRGRRSVACKLPRSTFSSSTCFIASPPAFDVLVPRVDSAHLALRLDADPRRS